MKAGQPVFRAIIGGVGRTSVTTAVGVGTNFVVAPIATSLAKSAGIDPIWANDIGIGTGLATSIFTGREAYKAVGNGAEVDEVTNPNSIYKSNPLENPKVAKDVIENPDAVYGYSLKPESKLNSFGVDWTNPDEVAYARSERIRYHEHLEEKKAMLQDEISKLQNDGYSVEDIARMKVEQRNQDRINNYIKSNNYEGLESMKQRNLEEYQRAEGPTADQLYKKYGSWEKVIYSSVRCNPAMDVVTGLYEIYGGN